MSRFYAKSDSESDLSSSEDEIQTRPVTNRAYIHMSDDDEKTKRVAKSTKDKKFEDLQSVIKNIRNHKKTKDMSNVLNDFGELCKVYEKAKKIIDKNTSRIFMKCLVELEDFVNENWDDTEGRKTMSKNNSKGLTALRQKLKKHNKEFEAELNEYRENPDPEVFDVEEKEADDLSDNDFSDDGIEMPKQALNLKKEDDDSDDEWNDDVDNKSSESDEETRPIPQLNADYFRKKAPTDCDIDVKKKKEEKKLKVEVKEAEDSGNEDYEDWVEVAVEKPELFPNDAEITIKTVLDKLAELTAGRGKKGTDRMMQIELLVNLREIVREKKLGDPVDCKIIFSIIASIFDHKQSVASSMKPKMWEKCLHYIREVLAILLSNVDTIVVGDHVADDSENFDGTKLPYRIHGCMLTVVERMDEEFMMMLRACDAHGTEYIKRLRDETTVCQIIEDLEKYLIGHASDEELCRLFLKRIQHIYYKFDKNSCETSAETVADPKNSRVVMDRLCKFIYNRGIKDEIEACATLSHIYHHALHDRFYEARDLMLMSHLQNNIGRHETTTQILHNRAMVQLGLCAFRQGLISDAHNCLVDILSSRRARELLAQDLLPQSQGRSPHMPYHMHINLELLECVYLVTAMLINIPAYKFDIHRKTISKHLYHVLKDSEKQTLVGPPENVREHVVAACKAMKIGNWEACHELIINEKMNKKIWDLFSNKENIKKMISLKIQEESLRCYLFEYSDIYDSFSCENLSEMFSLPVASICCIISKMIFNHELEASIDELASTIVMHKSQPSCLQTMALQLCNKLNQIVESNENKINYFAPMIEFFKDSGRVDQLTKRMEKLNCRPSNFQKIKIERFFEFNEWVAAEADVDVVKDGLEIEKTFWLMLDETTFYKGHRAPYDRKIYESSLKTFGMLLLRKVSPRIADYWPIMFEAWLVFTDSRCRAGCAPIFDKRKILLVMNQEHRWCFPKGKLDLREYSYEAASRELKEETGIKYTVDKIDEPFTSEVKRADIYVVHLERQEIPRPDGKEILDAG